MIVVDASVLATALVDDGLDGLTARMRLDGEELAAPELVDLEVTSVLRKLHRSGGLSRSRAEAALGDLIDLPLRRVPHVALLQRCWSLKENLTIYDAAYVVVTEVLDAVLLTADTRLARAFGPRCRIEIIATS